MIAPDILVENPLEDDERLPAAATLSGLATKLEDHVDLGLGSPGFRSSPYAAVVRQVRREHVAAVRLAATEIHRNRILLSLLRASHRAFNVCRDQLHATQTDADTAATVAAFAWSDREAQPCVTELAAIELTEIEDVGFTLRDAPPLPAPFATPAMTFTVGLSVDGVLPELVFPTQLERARYPLTSVAERVLRQRRMRSSDVHELLAETDRMTAEATGLMLRRRISNLSWGLGRICTPPELTALTPLGGLVPAHRPQIDASL
jgi:hypothetical protein